MRDVILMAMGNTGARFQALLSGTIEATSPDGRVNEAVVQDLIREQRELMNVKTEVPLNQVADFGPLNRVVKELNSGK